MATLHHRKYIRLRGYDYSRPGYYFVTICTHGRERLFGTVRKGKMQLSPAGTIARECWQAIPEHFPQVTLDQFCIMPDHLHGILIIQPLEAPIPSDKITNRTRRGHFGPQSMNLGSIIRGFKAGVTTRCKIHGLSVHWQSRYHDHIIRSHASLERIRKYIEHNPENWQS